MPAARRAIQSPSTTTPPASPPPSIPLSHYPGQRAETKWLFAIIEEEADSRRKEREGVLGFMHVTELLKKKKKKKDSRNRKNRACSSWASDAEWAARVRRWVSCRVWHDQNLPVSLHIFCRCHSVCRRNQCLPAHTQSCNEKVIKMSGLIQTPSNGGNMARPCTLMPDG